MAQSFTSSTSPNSTWTRWTAPGGRERPPARTARVTELTENLAQAITLSDVVQVMVDRVMRPFGAAGLLVSILEGHRIRLAGSVGYKPELPRCW